MLHQFRIANNLNSRKFDSLFIGRSDIVRERLGADDTVVFVDDFVGTGMQAVTAWEKMFQELTAEVGNVYLATVAAFKEGSERIGAETRIQLLTHRHLGYCDSLIHSDCRHFNAQEKGRLQHYCNMACPTNPLGFGDCGLVIVLYHQCPNNSLAILHSVSQDWEPLFPRN